MSSTLRCPGCHRRLMVAPEHAGKRLKCPACGNVLVIPRGEPHPGRGGDPSDVDPRDDGGPVQLAVRVVRDSAGKLKGAYPAELGPTGLLLSRRGREVERLPLDATARYEGRNRLRLETQLRQLEFQVVSTGIYQDRYTHDLVETWNRRRPPPRPATYRMPRLLNGLVWFPLAVGLMLAVAGGLIGGAIGGVLGALLMSVNRAIVCREEWPVAVRAALAGSLAFGSLLLVAVGLVSLVRMAPRGPSIPVAAVDRVEGVEASNETRRVFQPAEAGSTTLGIVQDPLRDCLVRVDDRVASIEVPGTLHDLSPRPGCGMDAPRIIRELDGDFEVEVLVRWDDPPTDPPAQGSQVAFHGAGLLVQSADDSSLVRLELAGFLRGGSLRTYVLFEHLSRMRPTEEHDGAHGDGPLRLRLARSGGEIRGAYSDDGLSWQSFPPFNFGAGRVKVGVAAVNTAARPLKASFTGYRLTPR